MIFKFCFHNEIHRCTRPPTDFSSLRPFLQSMFHTSLPDSFSVFYLDSNNEKVIICSQEEYELLLNSSQSGSLKIFVSEPEEDPRMSDDMEDSEIITHHEEKPESMEKIEKEEGSDKDDYEVLGEPLVQENLSQLSSQDSESSEESRKEEPIPQEDITEEVKEERDEPKKEEEPENPREEDENLERMVSSTVESRIYNSVVSLHDVPEDQDMRLREIVQETVKQQMPYIMNELEEKVYSRRSSVNEESQCNWNPQNMGNGMNWRNQQVRYVGEKTGILDQIKDFGKAIASQLKELPEAAMDMFDDIAQVIEGDPNIFFAGGRYPTSVCDKTKKLKELFPDKDLQILVKFVMGMPRHCTLNQIIELYIRKLELEEKKSQEENESVKE